MDENVRAARIGLDEAEALGAVEPLPVPIAIYGVSSLALQCRLALSQTVSDDKRG